MSVAMLPPNAGSPSHHKALTTVARAAAIVCACGAGFGATCGLLSPEDGPLLGYAVPIVAGLVIGVALALGYHNLINAAARSR